MYLELTSLRHFTGSHLCRRIALNVREAGRGPSEPGRLQAVQAIGWWLEEANIAQVSTNLTDYDVTPIHVAYEEVSKDAAALNLPVVGSEIVGLVPLATLLQVCASQHFCTSHHFYFTALLFLTSLLYLTSPPHHVTSTSRHFHLTALPPHSTSTSQHFHFTALPLHSTSTSRHFHLTARLQNTPQLHILFSLRS